MEAGKNWFLKNLLHFSKETASNLFAGYVWERYYTLMRAGMLLCICFVLFRFVLLAACAEWWIHWVRGGQMLQLLAFHLCLEWWPSPSIWVLGTQFPSYTIAWELVESSKHPHNLQAFLLFSCCTHWTYMAMRPHRTLLGIPRNNKVRFWGVIGEHPKVRAGEKRQEIKKGICYWQWHPIHYLQPSEELWILNQTADVVGVCGRVSGT